MFHNISCYKYKNVILFVQGFNIFFYKLLYIFTLALLLHFDCSHHLAFILDIYSSNSYNYRNVVRICLRIESPPINPTDAISASADRLILPADSLIIFSNAIRIFSAVSQIFHSIGQTLFTNIKFQLVKS